VAQEIGVEELQKPSVTEKVVPQPYRHKAHDRRPFVRFHPIRDAELHGGILTADWLRPANQAHLPLVCLVEIDTDRGRDPVLDDRVVGTGIQQAIPH
jgi:hypothetical protein